MKTKGHVNLAYIIIPSSLKPTFHSGSLAGSAVSHNPAASDTNSLCQIRGAKNSFEKGSHLCLLFKNPARSIRSSFAWAEILGHHWEWKLCSCWCVDVWRFSWKGTSVKCHSSGPLPLFKDMTSFDRALSTLPLALFTLLSVNLHVRSVASNINPRTFPRFWHVKALSFIGQCILEVNKAAKSIHLLTAAA